MGSTSVTVVEADAYVREMKTGGSDPHLVRCDDGNQYVVKLKNNDQGTQILANDYLVSRLAALVEAPVPEVTLVDVSAEFLQKSGVDSGGGNTPEPGTQFGSLFKCGDTGESYTKPSSGDINSFANQTQIPLVILMDTLVANRDRKGEHIVYHPVGDGEYRFWMVDHGHCLGVNDGWDSLETPGQGLVADTFSERITGWDDFVPGLERICDEVTESNIRDISSEMPLDEWGIASSDVDAVVDYLLEQKALLPQILADNRETFSNWGSEQ